MALTLSMLSHSRMRLETVPLASPRTQPARAHTDLLALLRAALPTGSCTFEKNGCGWAEGGKKNGWKRGTRTPSSSTGAAKGQGGKGSFYFLETSSGKKGDTSYLTHTITEGSDLYKSVSFYYHMHGATMGALSVQAQVGGAWRTVWKKEKQQQKKQTDKFIMAKVRHMKHTRLSSQGRPIR